MKSFFKRSAIGLIVLGVAGATNAAPYHYNNAWTPHLSGAFIGVDALYLRPENGDLDYVTVFPTISPGGDFNTTGISTDYHWDWRLYGGIRFNNNDDITVSWTRLRPSDHSSIDIFGTGVSSITRFLFINDWDIASAHVDFDLDQIYAVWGHTVCFNNPWSVRYAAGVEYAKLNSDLSVTGEDFGSDFLGFTADSHLKGWGPRVEFNATYHLPNGFALFADAYGALLASNRKVSLGGNANSIEDDEVVVLSNAHYTTRHVVVPNFGERLGVSYSYGFGQVGGEGCPCTTLTIDAGWQVDSYVHAIERPDPETSFIETAATTTTLQTITSFASTKTSNFGDEGLFLGIKLSSDWL